MRPSTPSPSAPAPTAGAFLKDRAGAVAIEYALIGVLIGVTIIAGATTLGTSVNARMQDNATAVGNAPGR
jgi:pilus assembly protein Flp/PilA